MYPVLLTFKCCGSQHLEDLPDPAQGLPLLLPLPPPYTGVSLSLLLPPGCPSSFALFSKAHRWNSQAGCIRAGGEMVRHRGSSLLPRPELVPDIFNSSCPWRPIKPGEPLSRPKQPPDLRAGARPSLLGSCPPPRETLSDPVLLGAEALVTPGHTGVLAISTV